MRSINYEESNYNLNLDILMNLLVLIVCFISYLARRSGLVGKSNHLRPIYLELKSYCKNVFLDKAKSKLQPLAMFPCVVGVSLVFEVT